MAKHESIEVESLRSQLRYSIFEYRQGRLTPTQYHEVAAPIRQGLNAAYGF